MKRQVIFRSNWAMSMILLIILVVTACQPPAPAPPAQATSTPESPSTLVPTSTSAPVLPTSPVEPTATSQPPSNGNPTQYQDDFTNKGSGWPTAKFDTYLFGYHEPEWYEVQVQNPNTTVPIITVPTEKKYSTGDATIELDVNTFPAKTAPEGDFRYGLVFRRSGDNYYAFTISQPTKKWYLLKNSSTGPVVLGEGSEESIHNRGENDHLRVDAKGPNFLLSINGQQVAQVTDSSYAEGQIGFYLQSIDSKQVHIHFDKLIIRDLALALKCSINAGMLYVRSGPGKKYPPIALLQDGDTVEALGVSSDREWIEIKMEGSKDLGWIFISETFMSCTPPIDFFPVVNP